jgi:hypothetical protein
LQFFCFEWGKEIWFKGFNVSVFIEMSLLKNKWIRTEPLNKMLLCLFSLVCLNLFQSHHQFSQHPITSICLSVRVSLRPFVSLLICFSVHVS